MANPLEDWKYESNGREDNGGYFHSPDTLGQYVERWVHNAGLNGTQNSVIGDWLQPAQKEARQLLLQQYQESVEPSIRMQAMIDAGINPLTAASGIAGSAPGNLPSPSSSTSPVGEIAGAIGSLAAGYGSVASGVKSLEEANQVKPLAESAISTSNAQIDKWSHENGFSDAQTEAFNIDNLTRNELNKADLNVKRQNFLTMREQAEHIKAQKDYVLKQIQWYDEEIQSEIDLNKKRTLEAEKHAFQMQEQTRTEKMENDFCEKFGYRRGEPFDNAMVDLWFQGEYDKVKAAQDFMYDYKYSSSYNEERGEQQALSQYAYIIANAQETAKSLNSIITDWSQPASSLWSIIDKSFNVSGNKHNANQVGNAIEAKQDPDSWAGYSQFVVGLALSLEQVNKEIEHASAQNELGRLRQLTKERDGLQSFMKNLTFDDYLEHIKKQ